MLFHKKSGVEEARILSAVGVGLILITAAAVGIVAADPFGGRDSRYLGVVFESPYTGQGVDEGTSIIMHGVEVGRVADVTNLAGGKVRLAVDLQREPTEGLTTAVGIDFRPANYFGVTGINLRPGEGGHPLTDGSVVDVTPAGDFTLQVLLTRVGQVSDSALTPQLISVIERATSYTDGLDPLLETILYASDALVQVQTVSTTQLLTNTAGISAAFPGFVHAGIALGDAMHRQFDDVTPTEYHRMLHPTTILATQDLFGMVGRLVGDNSTNLRPLTDLIKTVTDVVPGVVPADELSGTLTEARTRLETMFAGPPERRAVNTRVILENLPGVAAPLAAQGVTP